jgi:hypothetical protein
MNGNGIAAQRKAVEDYLNGGRWKLASLPRSRAASAPIALPCRQHKAKLVIAKLDRLSHFTIFPGESVEVMPVLPIPGS